MDEIDAALDFKNVSIVGHYVKERTKNAQFIIISLRSNMFELCDCLVGIYKTHNTTKSIALCPKSYASKPQPRPVQVEGPVAAQRQHDNTPPSAQANQPDNPEGNHTAGSDDSLNVEQPEENQMDVDSIPETPSDSDS